MKRKAEDPLEASASKRPSNATQRASFAPDLFDPSTIAAHKSAYASSAPYKHDVVHSLVSDTLLRSVRQEIVDSISFAPKETDIYKIHQSGDLANLDGLDASSLQQLPSLVKLRDALYGPEFRAWLEQVVEGCGKLSGTRTDMAVNVYTPGSHLLCHDDVIGTRRVSYILYLTDPEHAWRDTWGGALRLYPTTVASADGRALKTPGHTWTKSIPPAWNQLSFFAVQPGESFHDVEEVYHPLPGEDLAKDGGRVRMAISGWFHIPQAGEEGYEPGLEETLAQQSSLAQLQGKAGDKLDRPQPKWIAHAESIQASTTRTAEEEEEEDSALSTQDLEVLVQYLNPRYLVPETVETMAEQFRDESFLRLGLFLAPKFADKLRAEIQGAEAKTFALQPAPECKAWAVACPPHKQRFLYRQPDMPKSDLPLLDDLLNKLLPSQSFKKWLRLVTELSLDEVNVLARRFRRGLDYTLAKGYNEDLPRLECSLGLTPTRGWGAAEEEEGDDTAQPKPDRADNDAPEGGAGGYELYMAGDDDDGEDEEEEEEDGDAAAKTATHTGAGKRRERLDPAIYQTANDDDDGIMMTIPAEWNTFTLVLRDKGTMKFVKYVSRAAKGDRWDILGEWRVDEMPEGYDDDDDDDGDDGDGQDEQDGEEEDGEEEDDEEGDEQDDEEEDEK